MRSSSMHQAFTLSVKTKTVSELTDTFSSWTDDQVAGFGEANLKVVEPVALSTAV